MIKKILIVLLLLIGFVYADEPTLISNKDVVEAPSYTLRDVLGPEVENNRIVLYFFKGNGCSFCAKEEEWLNYVKETYGDYVEIREYEVWENHDNAELMSRVKEFVGINVDGTVPLNIIGDFAEIGIAPEQILRIENEIRGYAGLEPVEEPTVYLEIIGETGKNEADKETNSLIEPENTEPVCNCRKEHYYMIEFGVALILAGLASIEFAYAYALKEGKNKKRHSK